MSESKLDQRLFRKLAALLLTVIGLSIVMVGLALGLSRVYGSPQAPSNEGGTATVIDCGTPFSRSMLYPDWTIRTATTSPTMESRATRQPLGLSRRSLSHCHVRWRHAAGSYFLRLLGPGGEAAPSSTLLGSQVVVAGGADADPVREELLEVFQQGVEGQGCPSAFGFVMRVQVRNRWAAVARVAWWCQPVQLRPSKWSSPTRFSVLVSRARCASGFSPGAPWWGSGCRRAGWRSSSRWVRLCRQAIRPGATAAAGTRRRLGECHGWQAGSATATKWERIAADLLPGLLLLPLRQVSSLRAARPAARMMSLQLDGASG